MLRALLYAYVLGGITFIPLVVVAFVFITVYTSVPVGDPDVTKKTRGHLEADNAVEEEEEKTIFEKEAKGSATLETNDTPRTRKGWLTMRRTFEESVADGGYVTLVRSFLDSRSKDPKRSRPKDMWYVVLKGKVLYLYEDEEMSECEAAVELSGHQVVIYPEGLLDAELFAKRNAICLKPKVDKPENLPSVTKAMSLEKGDVEEKLNASSSKGKKREIEKELLLEEEKKKDAAREEALDPTTPWFIFVRSNVEMEDWYFALIHASEQPVQTPTLQPLRAIFEAADMNHLVSTLDEQPDVIPMRWLNALLGRIFFSHYRTRALEEYIIGRFMKKLSKVKRPAFLTEIAVTEVSVGNKAPMLSKPMLKELTKEGDASLEVHLQYKGEIRITVEATAVINLGARFKSYTVKLTLAAVLKELEGNLLIKVKRPPSNRIWYAFTQTPRMVLEVEPIVSDRQITWGMILSTIESKFKEIIQESVVMPNMDDIAFFETGAYEHRGGIWSDACRKPHVPSDETSTTQDDAQSVASAPLPDTASVTSTDYASSTPTEKADDASIQSAPLMTAVPLGGSPSSSSNGDDSTDSSRNNTRRRTWFSGVRDEELSSSSAPTLFPNTIQTDKTEEERGRSLEVDKSTSPRSQSTPNQPDVRPATPEYVEPESSRMSTHSNTSRRSVSQSMKVPNEFQDEEPVNSRVKSTPSTPSRNLDTLHPPRSPSPPSFFSTLKSKAAAADKQALQNTAKEAMRKWGVNWGGFKKDAPQSSEDGGSGSSPPRSGLHPDGNNSLGHKARASYAEVRAAVAERKERERSSQFDDDNWSDSLQPSSPPPRMRVLSTPKAGGLPNGSVYSDPPSNPSIITSAARLSSSGPRLTSKKSTPSLGRVSTEVEQQDKDVPEAEESVIAATKPAPIHVQPVAKTMSIPGIHASHRGEVQSMGYVAPQPTPPTPSAPGPVAETMLKNPAIQSVYRLWKNPPSQGQQQEVASDLQGQSASQRADRRASTSSTSSTAAPISADQVQATGLLAPALNLLSPPVQPTVKPTPPPLPPRSNSISISRAINGDASGSSSSNVAATASEVLKNIVQKDERNNRSGSQHSFPDLLADAGSTSTSETAQRRSRELDRDVESSKTEHDGVPLPSYGGGGHSETSQPVLDEANGEFIPSSSVDMALAASGKGTPPALPPRRIQTLA